MWTAQQIKVAVRQTHLGTPEIKVEDILHASPRSWVDSWKGKGEVSKVCSILLLLYLKISNYYDFL